MANWHGLLKELQTSGSNYDILRREYLARLFKLTNRNIIVYYSGWLQKPEIKGSEVNDMDKLGLMTVIQGLDKNKGLDLFLHTPGGNTAATESIVEYLRSIFGTNIRAIIPQLAMSAGTMIACSAKEIILGKHSNIGPIDPQIGGLPAHGIIEEFQTAFNEILQNPNKALLWQPIIQKYSPTLIGECQKLIKWSNDMVSAWLKTGMFKDDVDADAKIATILSELGDHSLNLSHARHIGIAKCKEIGLKIIELESDNKLQEAILSVHHACIHTLSSTGATKIIENHKGIARIDLLQNVMIQQG
jgi:ATP-dependent protease ClpP protease subunit